MYNVLYCPISVFCGPCSSSGKALGYGLDGPGSIPGVGVVEIFLYSFLSRLVLRSIQPPIKWVAGAFPRDKRRPSIGLATSAMAVYMWTLASKSSVGIHGLNWGYFYNCILWPIMRIKYWNYLKFIDKIIKIKSSQLASVQTAPSSGAN